MPVPSEANLRAAYVEQLRAQTASLAERGAWIVGNVYSRVLLVKGELDDAERGGGELLGGRDGAALRACLERLKYKPEEFCGLASCAADGRPLDPQLFREAVECIDPETVLCLDDAAADQMREAYAEELAENPGIDAACLDFGVEARASGRRVMALDGFEKALASSDEKQRMWRAIKKLAPIGEPC